MNDVAAQLQLPVDIKERLDNEFHDATVQPTVSDLKDFLLSIVESLESIITKEEIQEMLDEFKAAIGDPDTEVISKIQESLVTLDRVVATHEEQLQKHTTALETLDNVLGDFEVNIDEIKKSYATKSELNDVRSEIPSLNGYVTTNNLETKLDEIKSTIPANAVTENDLSTVLETYATTESLKDLSDSIKSKVDVTLLEGYYTKEGVNEEINKVKELIPEIPSHDSYVTTEILEEKLSNAEFINNLTETVINKLPDANNMEF